MTNCGDNNLRPRLCESFSQCAVGKISEFLKLCFIFVQTQLNPPRGGHVSAQAIYFSQAADSFGSRPVMGYMLACVFHGIIRWALERPVVWSANYLVCLPLIQGQKISNSENFFFSNFPEY